jgi:LAO/AO transport system kinase
MTDSFLLLALARSGDQLQGIKKGILEIADVVAVNKADGPHAAEAQRAARELSGALRLIGQAEDEWQTPVLTCSAQTGDGLDTVWAQLEQHYQRLADSGELERRRRDQRVTWMWALVRDALIDRLHQRDDLRKIADDMEADVRNGEITPGLAATRLLDAFAPGQH